MDDDGYPYRSLSNVARSKLPLAEKMHQRGVSWKRIAKELGVSYTALFVWRKLSEEERRGEIT